MKILVNGSDAICNYCGNRGAEVKAGVVICSFCDSEDLRDLHWNPFIPRWKMDARNPIREHWTSQNRRAEDKHALKVETAKLLVRDTATRCAEIAGETSKLAEHRIRLEFKI